MPDHVHMCISIPPKYAVSNVVGFIKGKSAISIARQFMGKTKNFTGENFWARGYFVSTVGLDEDVVKAYIQAQRFFIEHSFREAKSECGMADYQVRRWDTWHHHMALVMLGTLFLVK